ncbi:MAG TPA: 3-dehydroquinate synthase [Balneolales bacterium]|nr:3-dehydroquinate synthase [Balneolales bacterium]
MVKIQTQQKHQYPVVTGSDLDERILNFLSDNFKSDTVFLAIDENVAKLHGGYYRELFGKVFDQVHTYVVPAGEGSKSREQWWALVSFMIEHHVRRDQPLLAVGGGVTGDLAGFAAAACLRGVSLVHFPTTLLAMVDSSIGGKTGINHPGGKNLVGSFYQPEAVFADSRILSTLPEEEWLCGLGEVLKYGAIENPELFDDVATTMERYGFSQPELWLPIIDQSASIKARIVQADEKEHGVRSFLNFGHTFAHAIEAELGYGVLQHGMAVYAGMIAAIDASRRFGSTIDAGNLLRFSSIYRLDLSNLSNKRSQLIRWMYGDKKRTSGKLRLVLLHEWGKPYLKETDDLSLVDSAWKYLFDMLSVDNIHK